MSPAFDKRFYLSVFSVFVYLIFFMILDLSSGKGMAITAFVPVLVFGLSYGFTGGVWAGLISFPVNFFMFHLCSAYWPIDSVSIIGTIALMLMGGLVGRLRDVTAEVKKSRENLDGLVSTRTSELAEAKEQLEKLVDTSLDPINISDSNGLIKQCNRAFLELFGYSQQEVIGRPAHDFIILEPGVYESTTGETITIETTYYDEMLEKAALLLNEGKASCQAYFLRKDRKIVPVMQNTVLLRDDAGQPVCSFSIMRDSTEQRKSELALVSAKEVAEETSRKLERLIETSLDPIAVSDATGHFTQANKSFLDMLGCTLEEILGQPAYFFSVSDEATYTTTAGEDIFIGQQYYDTAVAKTNELFETGKISNWSAYYRKKDITLVPVKQNIVLLYNDQGKHTGAFAIIRDITQDRIAELELIRAKEVAEEANIAKGSCLANMSHEIRTPINGVIGFTDMLLETELTDEQHDFAVTVHRSAEALHSLLNDILDFSKIEAGRIEIEEIDFDIEVLAYDVCEMVWPRLSGKNVEILCRIDDELPARIKGDPHRIKQVLVNLMGNAIKFTEEGEIELCLAVEEQQGDYLQLHASVRDTGIGIAPEKLELIFNLFEQADGTTTRKFGGTGLGLAISRQIAGLMQGRVWAESQPGKGSTFHFTLRLHQSAEREVRRILPGSLSGKRALIADDNRANLDILMHALQLARMEVIGCLSGEEALNVLQGACGLFDICIFDIKMPTLDGYELARRIRGIYGNRLPMLAFSSSVQRGSARECLGAGFNGYLPKPINRIKLFKMIERLLGIAVDQKLLEQAPQAMIITQHSMREDAKLSVSILLAEDNIVNQKLASTLLLKAGYKVTVANNGREAVNLFTEDPGKYDIIFMDVQMPELNGIGATHELRQQGFDRVPIIALTAQAMKGDREKCLAAGMNDYLSKPIKREAVFEMLRKWVFDRSSEDLLPCYDEKAAERN